MKKTIYVIWAIASVLLMSACNKVNYKKTRSGLIYHIFPSSGKDSLIRNGEVVKFNVTTSLNDSVIYSSYGKLPAYVKLMPLEPPPYNILEILPMMKKGDSAITVQMIDTLIKRGDQYPPYAKKGDRMSITFRIIDVYATDSLATLDFNLESEKDRPRQLKEQEEQLAKLEKERKEQIANEELEMEKSGEVGKELKEMEIFLANKKIEAQKTGKGTFVVIKQQGTGPQAEVNKYVKVKYSGSFLESDSVFQASTYAFQLGKGNVIAGWDEGLQLLKQGGKATLYIPGFRAYGKNPPQNSPFKPYQALKFDVELLEVSDSVIQNNMR